MPFRRLLRSRSFTTVLSSACLPLACLSVAAGLGVVAPAVHAQSTADSLQPKKGEVVLVGKVLAVLPLEHRLAMSVSQVIEMSGNVIELKPAVNKSVTLPPSTEYYWLPEAKEKAAMKNLQVNRAIQVVGHTDGRGEPLAARVLAMDRDPDAEQSGLRKSMPTTQKSAWWLLLARTPAEAHGDMEKDGAYKITVTVPGPKPSSVQIIQGGLHMEDGQRWHLHFRAKADSERDVKLAAIVGKGDYHSIGLREEITLEPKWQDYDYDFTVDKSAEHGNNQCPAIGLGDKAGTIWISGLTLTEVKDKVKDTRDGKAGVEKQ